jgi:ribosome-binding ATPase YchF (GTP1/OBG family)
LNEGIPVIDMEFNTEEEKDIVYDLFLLTSKQRLFLLNCKEGMDEEKITEWESKLAELSNDPEKKYNP